MHAHACDHRTSVTQRSGRCTPHALPQARAVRCCATAQQRHRTGGGSPPSVALCRSSCSAGTHMLSAAFGGAGSKPIFETRLWAVPQLGTRMHLIHLTIMSTAQAQKNIMHTPRRPPPRRADRPLGWQMLHMRLREYNLDGCQTKSNRAISYISNDSQNMTYGDTMRTPL